jgi:hypothetical protein
MLSTHRSQFNKFFSIQFHLFRFKFVYNSPKTLDLPKHFHLDPPPPNCAFAAKQLLYHDHFPQKEVIAQTRHLDNKQLMLTVVPCCTTK